jgi:hypothetical protein
VQAIKLGLRAYRDFYDHIWWMLLVLVVWWILNVTVVFGGVATLLLFRVADPRQGIWEDRMGFRESSQYLLTHFTRGWKIELMTVPLVALVAFNLNFYGSGDHALAILNPVWLMLLVAFALATLVIFALGGVTERSAIDAWKTGIRMTLIRLPAVLTILLITAIMPFLLISTLLAFLYPLIFVLPGIVAIALSRYVLIAMNLAYPTPDEPTDERLREKKTG